MSRGRRLAVVVVAGALLAVATPASRAAPPAAPAAPRYSGLWHLDTLRSEMGRRRPRSREDHMSENGAWLTVRSLSVRASGDTVRLDYRYRIDGAEATNRVLGQDVKTKGRREGAALRFDSEAQLALFKFTVNERWTLSADGRTLTQQRTSRGPLGDEKQRLVFQRAR